jgi:hypothetical protein
MPAAGETSRSPLTLVHSAPASEPPIPEEHLHLPPSSRLNRFITTAAAAGLDPPDAVRLALERALALADACSAFPIDIETSRLLLRRAAAVARPMRQLTTANSRYVRMLSARRPKPVGDLSEGLVVRLPDRVVTRARGELTELALHEGVVEEMISWEIAAMLEGRTMCEWALSTLAIRRHTA